VLLKTKQTLPFVFTVFFLLVSCFSLITSPFQPVLSSNSSNVSHGDSPNNSLQGNNTQTQIKYGLGLDSDNKIIQDQGNSKSSMKGVFNNDTNPQNINKTVEFTDTNSSNQALSDLPFYIKFPKEWVNQRGTISNFDFLVLQNPNNKTFFQIFYNPQAVDTEEVILKNYLDIKKRGQITNTTEKSVKIRPNGNENLIGKEIYYEYTLDDSNSTVKDKYIFLANENGTFVLNPLTYNLTTFPDDLFNYMIHSFVPHKIEDEETHGLALKGIDDFFADIAYDKQNNKIFFVHDNDKIGVYDTQSHNHELDIDTDEGAMNVEYSDSNNRLFVMNPTTKQLSIYNASGDSIQLFRKVLLQKNPETSEQINKSRSDDDPGIEDSDNSDGNSLFLATNMAIEDINKNIFVTFSGSSNILKLNYNGTILEEIPFGEDNGPNNHNGNGDKDDRDGDSRRDSFKEPAEISIDNYNENNLIFVIDPGSRNVKAIDDSKNNSIIKEIPIDRKLHPPKIAIDNFYNKLYVASDNYLYSFEITNSNNSTNIVNAGKVPVIYPSNIVVNPINHFIYVPEEISNKIIVVDPYKFEKTNSTVNSDNSPFDIVFSPENNIGYVTHKGSQTITMFNGTDNKLLYFVKFQISPESAGTVICNGQDYDQNISLLLEPETQCDIMTNNGYRFSSLDIDDNVNNNNNNNPSPSSKQNKDNPQKRTGTSTVLEILDNIGNFFSNSIIKPIRQIIGLEDKSDSTFSISRNGIYSLSFLQEQQIPKEFWTPFYGILASFLIPFVIREILERRKSYKSDLKQAKQRETFIEYNKAADKLVQDLQKDKGNEEMIEKAEQMKTDVISEFKLGNLTESHYNYIINKVNSAIKNN
jgi:hypothetical protein